MNMKHIIVLIAAVCLSVSTTVRAQQTCNLSLDECRRMALVHSEDLQCADNALRQAEIDKATALAAYLPKIDGSVSGAYVSDIDMMGMELQMRGTYMAGITLTQPLYAGGKIRTGNKLAEIGRQCAEEERRRIRMQVVADADNAYWTYIAVLWKVKMLEAYKQQMDTLYGQMQVGLSAGMNTENDLLRVDTKRSDIDYQLQKARNGANLCRLSLCNVTGCSLESAITPTDTVITLVDMPPLDESLGLRPELHLLQKQVEMAEQQVKMARADVLPQIGLSAGYSYCGNIKMIGMTADGQGNPVPFTQKFDDGMTVIMASASIPLFHWGEGLKKIKRARIDVRNKELELQKNTRLMSIEVRSAIQNVMDSRQLASTATVGCSQADENLRIMKNYYENGMCSLIDLMDAQAQWQQAQSNSIEALTQCKIMETEYLRVTGRITE